MFYTKEQIVQEAVGWSLLITILCSLGAAGGYIYVVPKLNTLETNTRAQQTQIDLLEAKVAELQMSAGSGLNFTTTIVEEGNANLFFTLSGMSGPVTIISFRFIAMIDAVSKIRIFGIQFDPPPAPVSIDPLDGAIRFEIDDMNQILNLIQPDPTSSRRTALFESEMGKFSTRPVTKRVTFFLSDDDESDFLISNDDGNTFPLGTAAATWSEPFTIYIPDSYIGVKEV